MNWISRVAALFPKRKLDAELDDELHFHIEMQQQQNLRNGVDTAWSRSLTHL